MSLTIKEKFRRSTANRDIVRITTNIIEPWFNEKEKEFLANHEVVVDSKQLYDIKDCYDYDEYTQRQENGDYTWKFTVYVDGKVKLEDYANSSDYITSYIEDLM